jgi:manganese-dependent ADP-ribose/CDP-alcohol diphosphatase
MKKLHLILGTCVLVFTFTLKVFSQEKPLFTFGVMTDVQYADRDNAGSRYYRSSLAKLQEAVLTFNSEKVNFVVHLGDFINDDFHSYDTLMKITGKLEMPLFLVPGNHDFAVDSDHKEKILPLYGYKKGYQSFSRDGWRLILLDGTETSLIRFPKGSKEYDGSQIQMEELKASGAKNAFEWNGGFSERQFNWLKRNLNQAQRKSEPVILACHYPILPENATDNLFESDKVRTLIEKYPKVVTWFNGHTHVSRLIEQNRISFLSFKGMVEKETNAFAIVSVYKDHLDIKGFGEEVTRIINLQNTNYLKKRNNE